MALAQRRKSPRLWNVPRLIQILMDDGLAIPRGQSPTSRDAALVSGRAMAGLANINAARNEGSGLTAPIASSTIPKRWRSGARPLMPEKALSGTNGAKKFMAQPFSRLLRKSPQATTTPVDSICAVLILVLSFVGALALAGKSMEQGNEFS